MSIEFEQSGGVATVRINRPEKKNALSLAMRVSLGEIFDAIALDDNVRCVVLTGAGDAFCSGADVDGMGIGGLNESRRKIKILHRTIRSIYKLDKPVIAAVRGPAVGFGWSLALAADVIIAGNSARFSQVFRNVGLAPDGGAAYFLSRLVGPLRAKELVFGAETLSASQALELNLVNRLVEDNVLFPTVMELASSYARGPGLAFAMAKQLFRSATAPGFDEFLETEFLIQPQLQQSSDHKEGIAAFREKRSPNFTGA